MFSFFSGGGGGVRGGWVSECFLQITQIKIKKKKIFRGGGGGEKGGGGGGERGPSKWMLFTNNPNQN